MHPAIVVAILCTNNDLIIPLIIELYLDRSQTLNNSFHKVSTKYIYNNKSSPEEIQTSINIHEM